MQVIVDYFQLSLLIMRRRSLRLLRPKLIFNSQVLPSELTL